MRIVLTLEESVSPGKIVYVENQFSVTSYFPSVANAHSPYNFQTFSPPIKSGAYLTS